MMFFDVQTGELKSRTWSGPAHALAASVPKGCRAISGNFDHRTQRVDVEALAKAEPGDYSTPLDFVVERSDADEQREQRQAELADRQARRALDRLDARYVRPILELRKNPNSATAEAAIAELDAEAAELRKAVIPTRAEIERAERLSQSTRSEGND